MVFSYIYSTFLKFKKLVSNYQDQGHGVVKSIFYSLRLVYKRNLLESYSSISTVREKNFLFVKTVTGGTVQLIPFRVRSGPKPVLEYAYFDRVRKDELFNLLSGPNRDFNGLIEALFLFGKEIRYKYLNQSETTIRSEIGNHDSHELEKKILSIGQPYI